LEVGGVEVGAAGVEVDVDVRGGDKSSGGGGLGFAILELGREAGVSPLRFFTAEGSVVGGERSKLGESSLELVGARGGVVGGAVEGGGLEAEGGRSIRGFLGFGSVGITSFKFFVAAARVLSRKNQISIDSER
jgi:hypothetical protein